MVKAVAFPVSENWVEKAKERSRYLMETGHSCAQGILSAFMEQFGIEDKMVLRAAGGFHGGMMCSLTCGIVTGAMMFLGLLIGRENIEEGMEGLMPIIMPAQELVSLFTKRLGSSSCKELTGVDFTDLNQAIAFQMSGDNKKCLDRMEQGAEELALFLIEKQKKGELFRIS